MNLNFSKSVMQPKKIIGWALLIAGLLLIFWTLYSTYSIFTAKKEAPEVFKIEKEEQTTLPEKKKETASEEEIRGEMKEMIEEQIKEIVPSEILSKLLNLMSWSILAGILIFGGSRISGIGIRLIKGE
jgi:hypothetical protein